MFRYCGCNMVISMKMSHCNECCKADALTTTPYIQKIFHSDPLPRQ